jgi:hypothetical protein
MRSPTITDLAAAISRNTQIVNDYFVDKNLPLPSFDVDGPLTIAIPHEEKEVAAAHVAVLSDTLALHDLIMGPEGVLRSVGASISVRL